MIRLLVAHHPAFEYVNFCFSTITLGRVGSFPANDLIGQPYGLSYEIVEKRLRSTPPQTLQEVGKSLKLCNIPRTLILYAEDTDATNELINDGQFVQPLTLEEIEALKQSGVHATVGSVRRYQYFATNDVILAGHNKKTDRATCKLLTQDRV